MNKEEKYYFNTEVITKKLDNILDYFINNNFKDTLINSIDCIKYLQHQLEEKDKVINETIEFINSITWPDGCIDCEPEDTKELLEILERDKEAK